MKKIVWIIALAIILCVGIVYYFSTKSNDIQMYQVHCDEQSFQSKDDSFMYAQGDEVELLYALDEVDAMYTFEVEGVDTYECTYEDEKGYLLTLKMPENDVTIVVHHEEIETLTISVGGGFGTRASTETIAVVFEGDHTFLQSTLHAYDGKEETVLRQEIDVDRDDISELFELVYVNLDEIQNDLHENNEILDGYMSYITIDGDVYGGYMIANDNFNVIINQTFDMVNEDDLYQFRKQIFAWYGEEMYD